MSTNPGADNLLSSLIGKTASAYIEILSADKDSSKSKFFPVQFNPSTIQIYASCTSCTKSNAAASKKSVKALVDTPSTPTFDMTVTLLFDAVFPADSFMWEKFNTFFTSPVSAQAIKTAASAAQKKVYTVQPQVEALISALRNPDTRIVKFHWAELQFCGQLRHVMAKYTMFSVSGRPVRAEVTLRLHQSNPVELAVWQKDFNDAFGGNKAETSLVRPGQKGGSLLNFNF